MSLNRIDLHTAERKDQILTPGLLIDLDAMESNIALMSGFFASRPAKLRPHFKTHKSPHIARIQMDAGAIGMTCAKLSEADVLVQAGVSSILIANQVIGLAKVTYLAQLAHQSQVIAAVDNAKNVSMISDAASAAGSEVGVVVEVNVGLDRCGLPPGEEVVQLAHLAHSLPGVRFLGVMGYEGHTVFEPDESTRSANVDKAMGLLVLSADLVRKSGLPVEIVSAGGTGTFHLTGAFPGVTEVEAGSYLFMDAKYQTLGLPFRQAVTLLATVISTPTPGRAVIDAGMKTLTTDNGLPEVVSPAGIKLARLNEEHGHLVVAPSQVNLQVGDKVEIVPSHICTTVNLHDRYYALRGDSVETVWPVTGRGKSQ